jgi:hypothetical protein
LPHLMTLMQSFSIFTTPIQSTDYDSNTVLV